MKTLQSNKNSIAIKNFADKFKNYFQFCFVIFILAFGPSRVATAATFLTSTINSEVRNPFTFLFGISEPEYFYHGNDAKWTIGTELSLTNYLSVNNKQDEVLVIDGETWSYEYYFLYKINQNWRLKVNIPWLKNSGGFADNFIFRFHEALQLPQNGRTQEGRDQAFQFYRFNGETLFNNRAVTSGVGDVALELHWQPKSQINSQWTFSLELPTGDFESLTGNEGVDIGMSYLSMNPSWFRSRAWLNDVPLALWFGFGVSFVDEAKELKGPKQNRLILSHRTGIGWQISPDWIAKAQFDTNSPFFDSETRELGWFPIQFSFGSDHYLGSNRQLKFSWMLAEDMRPRGSPDVIITTNVEYAF